MFYSSSWPLTHGFPSSASGVLVLPTGTNIPTERGVFKQMLSNETDRG